MLRQYLGGFSHDYRAKLVNPVGTWSLRGKAGVDCLGLGERVEERVNDQSCRYGKETEAGVLGKGGGWVV